MTFEELTAGFNEAQRDAVLYCDGPSLVVAGAGSGKTRVLTYKIAYLMTQGVEPWSILALTFTNKAANEMKQRIASIVGAENARYLWMGTFHSIFLRILRVEHERIGFSQNFTIYDASDSKSLVKSIIKEMELDDKTYKPSSILGRISMAKNQLQDAQDYYDSYLDYQQDMKDGVGQTRDIFLRYANRCRQADAMDFDDILLYTYRLFDGNPDIAAKYEGRFKYVLVDEYQDTNYAQHRIVWQLTQHRQKVCVVGDDAQSIYSFRGAKIDNILQFSTLYDNVQTFKLERNYRSTKTIVNAANSLIHKNKRQIFKNVFSEESEGERIPVMEVNSDVEEGGYVTRKLLMTKRTDDLEYSDFAVLYRTNAQSRIFEDELRKMSIPYKVYGGLSFYQRKEIKDVVAYFRLAVNPNDEEALKRVINYPARGIGQTTVNKIVEAATRAEVSLWDVICEPLTYGLKVNAGTAAKIAEFRDKIVTYIDKAQECDADEVGRYIISDCGIINDIYQDRSPENLSRQENVEELTNALTDFCESRKEEGNEHITLNDYLSEISLLSDVDSDKNDDSPKVTLMTIHSAKGLEFNTVFVVGLEEGLFPNQMSYGSQREIEEERRLFYVAITRAKEHCFLSYSTSRFRYGKMEFAERSRFIADIEPQFLEFGRGGMGGQNRQSFKPSFRTSFRPSEADVRKEREDRYRKAEQHLESRFRRIQEVGISSRVPVSAPASVAAGNALPVQQLRVGQRIEHERFGKGTVRSVEGSDASAKATIEFDNVGTKQLLLKFAKIRVLG